MLSLAFLVAAPVVAAQQAKTYRAGFLGQGSPPGTKPGYFETALQTLGYVEGGM